ncbi:MAG: hypothetical protein QOD32_2284 [Pyrinomonadaceae bacterium]|jgi:hypothetical protein|nr:hypothetical protein [Pyrinomonadaceae bacterium]
MTSSPGRLRTKILLSLAALLALLTLWIAFDLNRTHATELRKFDADEVARLETAMWRSYYERRRVRLFAELAGLLRTQYRFSFWKSNRVALSAARAAFVFKDGHSRDEYERALPHLVEFYRAIREASDVPFDVERVARLELEWWIVHRERAKYREGDLARALAEAAAEIYRVPAERLSEHGRLRAEAMTIRDTRATAPGGVTEADWAHIDALLRASWQSLFQAVNS